ncbi:hypothetical protein BGX31_009194 [Mortierella sp. GBA43]|nr:hypothetical protein BGX31_009194 [Mortierella sp. GBA43]
MRCLRGKPIADVLSPDQDSCHPQVPVSNTIQSFTISEQAARNGHNIVLPLSTAPRDPRRVHSCIHTSVPLFASLSEDPVLLQSSLSDSAQSESSPQDHDLSQSLQPYNPNCGFTTSGLCRIYVLKDVTEIHSLACAVQTDLMRREPVPRPARSPRSPPPPSTSSSSARGLTLLSKDRLDASRNASRQKPCRAEGDPDWTACTPSMSPLFPSSAEHALVQRLASQGKNKDLLLLHVTRFGTIDHAFVMPQPFSYRSSYYNPAVHAARNTSVMSYAHPDDIRTLCRALDRVCKSLPTTFRIRWRLQRQRQGLSDPDMEPTGMERRGRSGPGTEIPSRTIEFKGESFEEWFDPTATSSHVPPARAQDRYRNGGDDDKHYFWAEVKGIQSKGQPLLVVRSLTDGELERQRDHGPRSTNHLTQSRRTREEMGHDNSQQNNQHNSQQSSERITSSKKMEEGMRLSNRLNLSALTTLKERPQQQQESSLRTSGSYTTQHLLPQSVSVACCRLSGPSSSSGTMPTMITFQVPTSRPPWTMFVTIALDAWKQWIHTVHLGQAQFQDWCEYVLDITLDQMIDSVFWGLTLVGMEKCPIGVKSMEESEETKEQPKQMGSTESLIDLHLNLEQHPQCEDDQHSNGQQVLSSIQRVTEILHSYPTIEGAVYSFGNSWLGRKIKHRLEHKLEAAADHIFYGWSWCSGVEAALSALPLSVGSATGSAIISTLGRADNMQPIPVVAVDIHVE